MSTTSNRSWPAASSSASGMPDTSKLRLGADYYRDGCGDFLSNRAALSWWKSGLALQTRFGRPGPRCSAIRRGALKLTGRHC
jgi:hypothetical protein